MKRWPVLMMYQLDAVVDDILARIPAKKKQSSMSRIVSRTPTTRMMMMMSLVKEDDLLNKKDLLEYAKKVAEATLAEMVWLAYQQHPIPWGGGQ